MEEKKDMELKSEKFLIKEHGKTLSFFMFLFFGFVISFALWYAFLPTATTNILFEAQISEIEQVQNLDITGNAVSLVGVFGQIFFNNMMVMAFALLFAFFYGVGAIFILTWNASVIGAAMGNFIRSNIGELASSIGLSKFSAYFGVVSLGLLRYSIHGIPEIIAYFYGGLAGGIISVAIIKKHFKNKNFSRILFDVSELLLISLLFLIIAAFLEVYITPLLF